MIRFLVVAALYFAAHTSSVFAQLNVPSDGSDGALNVTTNTVIDLSEASYGTWSDDNSANIGNGVYDPEKWAVVFKYSSVTIAPGATVSFLNHPSHAPVVWLVQSNVVVNGAVSLDGQGIVYAYPNYLLPNEPGPGGFRGGAASATGYGDGYGPGGGRHAGSYGSTYGNPEILPLLGGSGGPAYNCGSAFSGPSPGGAVLIAASGSITVNGQITALGNGYGFQFCYDGSSGDGAIRIIADQVLGTGAVNANGGRTRVEANSISSNLVITPNTVTVPPGATPAIWPATNAPTITVVSVNNVTAPADPLAAVATSSDVNIAANYAVNIIIQSQYFPPDGTISVRIAPKYGGASTVNAVNTGGTFTNATWLASTVLPQGFCVIQAHATSP